MIETKDSLIEYLFGLQFDPVANYIFIKEILKRSHDNHEYVNAYNKLIQTNWYCQLLDEQLENGSWGRFHTQDTKASKKRVFKTTEIALKRASDLSLDRNDVIVNRSIKLMERYLLDEEKWTDTNEKHFGFEIAFKTLIASNLALFDPSNQLLSKKREICLQILKKAYINDTIDEDIWNQECRKHYDILLSPFTVYPLMLMQNASCMEDTVQHQYLNYVWHRKDGIYYTSNMSTDILHDVDSKGFIIWLSTLEILSGFSLFPLFMKEKALPHLYNQINRLINDDITFPPFTGVIGHYSESWRNRDKRKNDMLLRIARIIVKC